MTAEDLTCRIACLDKAARGFSGRRRLHNELALLELKAELAGRRVRDLQPRLQALPRQAIERLDQDIDQAAAPASDLGARAQAFEKAVALLHSVVATRH